MIFKWFIIQLKFLALYRDRISKWDDLHSVVVILLFLTLSIMTGHSKGTGLFNQINWSFFVIDMVFVICIVIVSILSVSFSKKKNFIELHNKIKTLSKRLHCSYKSHFRKYLSFQTQCIIVLVIEFILAPIYGTFNVMHHFILFYMVSTVMMHNYFVIDMIQTCCKRFTEKVMDLNRSFLLYNTQKQHVPLNVDSRSLLEFYDMISEVVGLVNKVYGIQILLIVLLIIIQISRCIQSVLQVLVMPEKVEPLILLCGILRVVVCTKICLGMITSCNGITKELKSTAAAGFETLLHLPLKTKFPQYESTYEDIITFQYLIHDELVISAAGFFSIDSKLIFKMLGVVTSNLLIVLSFQKELIRKSKLGGSNSDSALAGY